jgi:pimeloyl-ACP methyl ester carboxylesterase
VPEVRANGVTLFYEEQGAGEAIVGLHGSGSSSAFWADAAAELGTRGRAIVYDRRGHHRSELPGPYRTDCHEQADDAAALIAALGASPAIVIGRSYGGAVAVDLALRYPAEIRALVLLEGDVPALSAEQARWIADVEAAVLAADERDPDSVAETLLRAVAGDTWDALPEPVQDMFTRNGPAIVAELRGGYPDVTWEDLGAIACPTLLLTGADSPAWFAELSARVARAMPSAQAEVVEGGHLVDPAHPLVLAFVDDVLAGA